MNEKQKRFAEEYIVDLNATQSAIRTGYAEATAYSQGQRLLKHVEVQALIQKLKSERSDRTQITADNVLKELAKLGFSNVKNLYDENGKLKEVHKLDDDVSATVQEITEESIGDTVTRRKYKTADKKSSLELLGKHLKLFTDKVELNPGTDEDGKPKKWKVEVTHVTKEKV